MKKTIVLIMLLVLPVLATIPRAQIKGLYDDNSGFPGPLTSILTGNDPMSLRFKVSSPNGFGSLSLITVTIWDTNFSTVNDINSENHAEFIYNPMLEDWSLLNGSPSWSLNKLISSTFSSTNTSTNTFEFLMVFTPGKQATVESQPDWTINIRVTNGSFMEVTNVKKYYSLRQVSSTSSNLFGGGVFYASPNPFNLDNEQKITFLYSKNFGTACTLKLDIFTIYGDLVKTIASSKAFTGEETLGMSWDGKNGAGRFIASGIYTAVLTVNYAGGHKEKQVFNFAVYK